MSNMGTPFPPEIANLMAQLQKLPQSTMPYATNNTLSTGQNSATASFFNGLMNPQKAVTPGASANTQTPGFEDIARSLIGGANAQAGSQIAAVASGK